MKEKLDMEVCFRINSEVREKLQALAEMEDRSEAAVIRIAIKNLLKEKMDLLTSE